MAEKIVLELSREHAEVVQDACELLMRMKLGQTTFPTELMLGGLGGIGKYDVNEFCMRRDAANDVLRAFLRITGNKEGCEKDKVENMAYEVFGTIRHALFMDRNPDGDNSWSVASQPPLAESGLPMPKCKVVDG